MSQALVVLVLVPGLLGGSATKPAATSNITFPPATDFIISHGPLRRALSGAEIQARLKLQPVVIDNPLYETRTRRAAS
jgi:hypothetical protein